MTEKFNKKREREKMASGATNARFSYRNFKTRTGYVVTKVLWLHLVGLLIITKERVPFYVGFSRLRAI